MPLLPPGEDVFCRGEAALQQSLFEVQLLMAVEPGTQIASCPPMTDNGSNKCDMSECSNVDKSYRTLLVPSAQLVVQQSWALQWQ